MGNILNAPRQVQDSLGFGRHGDELFIDNSCWSERHGDELLERECLLGRDDTDGVTVDLPDDIISEILSRLPVKSVLRLRCVCKAWKTLISSSAFTHMHFSNHSSRQSPRLFLQCRNWTDSERQVAYALPAATNGVDKVCTLDEFRLPFLSCSTSKVQAWDSSMGIICLCQNYGRGNVLKFTLWNPATREYRLIPPSSPPLLDLGGCLSVGFVFLDGDFKLMAFRSHGRQQGDNVEDDLCPKENHMHVDTFSLAKNCWRSCTKTIKCSNNLTTRGRRVKTYLHWFGYIGKTRTTMISFDMIGETFGEPTRLPLESSANSSILRLRAFKESKLALFVYEYGKAESAEIWLTNYKGQHKWTKHMSFKAPGGIPIGFWWEEIIFVPCEEPHLDKFTNCRWEEASLYNPTNRSFRKAPFLRGPFLISHLVTHRNTLFSIKRY